MVEKQEVYKCSICGNIVEVLHNSAGKLACCGQEMELLEEIKEDVGAEKHVPIVMQNESKINVKIGSVPHPMESGHFIEWVEVISKDGVCRKFFNPGDKPEADFNVKSWSKIREFCSVHGLWVVEH